MFHKELLIVIAVMPLRGSFMSYAVLTLITFYLHNYSRDTLRVQLLFP